MRDNPPYYITAYAIAVKRGFEGSEEEWLKSLVPNMKGYRSEYQYSGRSDTEPEGEWKSMPPAGNEDRYLWVRLILDWENQEPVKLSFPVRMGLDGTGSIRTVAGLGPDRNGNVPLDAKRLGAVEDGKDIAMDGKRITGMGDPLDAQDAVTKEYADTMLSRKGGAMIGDLTVKEPTQRNHAATKGYVDGKKAEAVVSLSAAGWNENRQRVPVAAVKGDSTVLVSPGPESWEEYGRSGVRCVSQEDGMLEFLCENVPDADLTVCAVILN